MTTVSKAITIRSLAKAAGVSPSTVFRALNQDALVAPKTLAKIQAAQRLLEAGDDVRPASLAKPCSIGIIMPSSTAQDIGRHPSMFVIITSFISELSAYGASNSVIVFDESTMRGEDLLGQEQDGYLIIGTSEEQEGMILPALSKAAIPSVMINRRANASYVSSVIWDDIAACLNATRYLIQLGHKKIGFLGGNPNYQNTKRRLQGYANAMVENGLDILPDWIQQGAYTEVSGYSMGQALAKLPHLPTAVLCASDPIAIGCMRALEENGISVPGDISIVGFGDIEASRCITPSLTTVMQPGVEAGKLAAKVLCETISNPAILQQQLMLKTNMVLRNSTAAPKREAAQPDEP